MAIAPAVLDKLDLATLRTRKSEKWHTYPADVLPAWVAEMDFPLAEPIREVLQRALDLWDVGYPTSPNTMGLREAFAERMNDHFGWRIEPGSIELMTEVVQGLYVALEAFCEPGDGVVVQTPIYPPFLKAVKETGRRLVENRLAPANGHYEIDFDALRSSIDANTRILTLCNPHNPTGRVFSEAELGQLAEIVLRHDLVAVSDEIHCDLLYDGREHLPFAMLSPEVAARTVTLNSASKSFNIPGLRCALAHFGDPQLQRRFTERFARKVRGGLGILGLYASLAAWRESQPWLDEVVPYLEANRDWLVGALRERIPEIECFVPEGTYLMWLDCSALAVRSPAGHFIEHGKVALSYGRPFGPGYDQFARINFATSREILAQVVDRMAGALEQRPG
jgi:cystathionine beta-lyase